MNQIYRHLKKFFERYPGRAYGASAGFVIGVLLLTIGFKRTLFILLITLLGFLIGFLIDSNMRIPGFPLRKKSNNGDDDLRVYYEDEDTDESGENIE
ncbi:MAG TPA: DUF2273 domain-containing protein [Spirochaetota bacterium]|nr:DUF2273 domain-containing protein [Spirochaetota bacterium]